ncbi:hypothetical protein BDV25DRAFT_43681 [Aspergillus avenaceus]|uniref:Transmembrane protein n=1 Tax=Aspergillus avenaceus TaxID=36643 RepID=A0A5N6TKP2_ASPAV|nr:hypothetical protein BDV25DRAFT_43681 [Aspergillus avenaceus]
MNSPQYQELGYVSHEQPTEECEAVRSTWTWLACLSSNLIIVGFLVLPLAFHDTAETTHVDGTGTVVAALTLLGCAYGLSLLLFCAQHHQRVYLLHSIFLPCLFSNLLGLLNVALNIIGRGLLPVGNLGIVGLVLASVSAMLYALGALWVYGRGIANEFHADGSGSEPATALLTEEEMQRQQLLRLLQEKKSKKKLSPKMIQKTYKVTVPEHINPGKGWNSFMPPPRDDGYYR